MTLLNLLTTLLVAPALAAPSPSSVNGSELPFSVTRLDSAVGEVELAQVPEAITALDALSEVRLAGFPLPDGSLVDLELERLDLDRLKLGYQVDGNPTPELIDGLDLSVWVGAVAGQPDSIAALSFSQAGSRGWIQIGDELIHLAATASEEHGWSRPEARLMTESRLLELGLEREPYCMSDELAENIQLPRKAPDVSSAKASGAVSLYEATIAIETDFQLNQVFGGNLAAETAYVTSLITWVSWRYEEELATVLTYPYVQFYTNANDPWSAQDNGGNCIDVLFELQTAWMGGNIPTGAEIGHLLSGGSLGCGVAWLPGLCNDPYNFSVSGNIDGNVSFPVQVSPSNWDFMVLAHELGHNFGSPHTHDYCPPLDECAPNGYFGQCQTQQQCTNQGTIMSYCHLCNGGLSNITTFFHPSNLVDMRAWVESTCLPLACGDPVTYCTAKLSSLGCVPDIGWEGHPTLGGLDDFAVTADQIHNNQNGLLFHSATSAATAFNGGTLCVAPPITRLAVQSSGGSGPPTNDCSGSYVQPWSHADLSIPSLGAGATVFAQYWFRDAASQGGTGLSNGLEFTICN